MSSRFVCDIYLLRRPLRRSYSASAPENLEENQFEISEKVYICRNSSFDEARDDHVLFSISRFRLSYTIG